MSRRESRRGGGAIKGLSAVLVALVALMVYIGWRDALTLTDIPGLFLAIPFWFYIIVSVVAIGFLGAVRALQVAHASAKASQASRAVTSDAPRSRFETVAQAPPPLRPGVVRIEFTPVVRSPHPASDGPAPMGASFLDPQSYEPPKENDIPGGPEDPGPIREYGEPPRMLEPEEIPPAAPRRASEPVFIPELDASPEPMSATMVESAPVNAPVHPETLLSRLMNWLDETSPEVVTQKPKRRAGSAKRRRSS